MRFNADDHQDRFAAIVGEQRFRVEKVSQDFTKAGDPYLNAELKLLDLGRLHWERFILEHANPKVVEIAMGKLSSLSRAVGCPQWDDEQELVGRVGVAVFGPQKDNADFSEIKRYVTDAAHKAAPADNPHRAAARNEQRGGQLRETIAASGPRQDAPHPADDFDTSVPF